MTAAVAPTRAQLGHLKWLIAHNGDGVFDRSGVLLAGGERSGAMRSTWNALRSAGLVEEYAGRARLRVSDAGRAIDLSRVKAGRSASKDEGEP